MADGPSYRSGEWEQWLDPSPAHRESSVAVSRPDPDDRLADAGDAEAVLPPVAPDDAPKPRPSLIDRSGSNPGPRLRNPRPRRPNNRRADKTVAALIMVGLAVVVVSIVLTVIHTTRDRTPSTVSATTAAQGVAARPVAPLPSSPAPNNPAPSSPAPGGQSATFAADGCEQRRTADVVSGTDPGGTRNGPDAILAFQRAYYVQRSGFAARAVVADDANVPPPEQIQRGINQVPVGTRYCVQVTRAGQEGQWEVRLTQQEPGAQPRAFTQVVTTHTLAQRTLISAIHSG